MEKNSENMELKRILDILRSKTLLLVTILIVFTLLGYVYSYYYVVPKYQSTASLLLIPNNTEEDKTITTTDLNINSELISTYSNIAKQSRVLKQVISNLNLEMTEQELLKELKVQVLSDTYMIELSVTNTNPQIAASITKELSNVFLEEIKSIYHLNNIGIVDEAQVPDEPSNINHIRDIAIFFIAGLAFAAVIVAIIYIVDNTIKQEEDIERYIKLKTIRKNTFKLKSKTRNCR